MNDHATHTYHIRGLAISEHDFRIPLDHDRPDRESIAVFAREVAEPDGRDRPYLVFFQGGPGHEAPRPLSRDEPAWLARALRDYRVLLLDQRGTGRSTPIGPSDASPQQQRDYLMHFRADSIVRDAEWIRRRLDVERWSVLGQSFGGFCVVTYLSFASVALTEAYITGGLPPLDTPIDDVYRALYLLLRERNARYYERYPEDRARVAAIHERLESDRVLLPSGDRLTSRRFRQVGAMLGMSDGAERLHYIVESPIDSPAFRHDVEAALPFARNPLYAVLHEACYGDGFRTNWSAARLEPSEVDSEQLFTAEMIAPWMFDEYSALRPFREAAELLAQHEWGPLYDSAALRRNDVPVAAAIYANDLYVERGASERTAATVRGLRTWLTSEYEHNGLRADGERILDRLIALARGRL